LILCFGAFIVLVLASASKLIDEVKDMIQEFDGGENIIVEELFNNPKSIKEPVIVGDLEWVVTSAKDLGSSLKNNYLDGDDCVSDNGKFIEVEVKVKNHGKTQKNITNLDIYDSEKNAFSTSFDVFECVASDYFLGGNINPGLEKKLKLVYEVPTTSSDFRLKVEDFDFLSTKHQYISLGF
jgi:hypothetical protein